MAFASRAVAGHGARIAVELDPVAHPGVFTPIAELNGDIKMPTLTRAGTEVTPHNATIDYHVLGVLSRSALEFSVNYVFDDPTHDSSTGLTAMIIDNTMTGFQLWGPGGSAGVDEVICSGQVMQVSQTNPVRTGVRTSDVQIQLSGPFKVDGDIVGI